MNYNRINVGVIQENDTDIEIWRSGKYIEVEERSAYTEGRGGE